MRMRHLLGLSLSAILIACGGGSGSGSDSTSETLYVSLTYSSGAYLLQPSSIRPQLSGFNGHSPECSLGSGTLPAGMVVNSDCSISGTPTEAGTFNVVVHVGASGVSNQIDWNLGFPVLAPSTLYPDVDGFDVGAAVDLSPLNTFWQPLPGQTIGYSIGVGALPQGLVIEPTTGRITGHATDVGSFSYEVRADVAFSGQTAFVQQQTPTSGMTSLPVSRGYPSTISGWVGEPLVDVTPITPGLAGATYEFEIEPITPGQLPNGLIFDPATGRLSGTALESYLGPGWSWTITERYNGLTHVDRGSFMLALSNPIYVAYADNCFSNRACDGTPKFVFNDPTFTGATLTYSIDPTAFPLPSGMVLDASTGIISGVATRASSGATIIDVLVTRGGTSFTITAYFLSQRRRLAEDSDWPCLTNLSSVIPSFLICVGLVKYSSIPAARHRETSCSRAFAESPMIGSLALGPSSSRIAEVSVQPSISGIRKSVMSAAKRPVRHMSRARRPFVATCALNPSSSSC